MEINLSRDQTIADVQAEFTKQFPKLKIEFFKHDHEEGDGSPLNDMIEPTTKLGEIMTGGDSHFDFDQTIKVGELEQSLKEYFGLNIQVFRLSNKTWIQTTLTDDWTLQEEEELAEEMSNDNNNND